MSDWSDVSPDSLGSEKGKGAQDDKHSEANAHTPPSKLVQINQLTQVNKSAQTTHPPRENLITPTRRPATQESPQFKRRDPYSTPLLPSRQQPLTSSRILPSRSSKITKSFSDLSTPERTHLRVNAERSERYDLGTVSQRNPITDAQWTNDVFEADSPGRPLPLNEVIEEADFWTCTQCGMKNLPTNGNCSHCEEEI
jgi:hypothetical protein